MFISGMAEVLACLAIIPALARFGRVKIYSGGFILSGAACIIVAVILWTTDKNTLVWLVISIAMTGKFLISGTFALSYLYTAELFPTPVRNVAVGGASTFARIGSASAPYIVDILGETVDHLMIKFHLNTINFRCHICWYSNSHIRSLLHPSWTVVPPVAGNS